MAFKNKDDDDATAATVATFNAFDAVQQQENILKSVIQELREIGNDSFAESFRNFFLLFVQDPLNNDYIDIEGFLTASREKYANQDSIARLLNDVSLEDIRSFDSLQKTRLSNVLEDLRPEQRNTGTTRSWKSVIAHCWSGCWGCRWGCPTATHASRGSRTLPSLVVERSNSSPPSAISSGGASKVVEGAVNENGFDSV